jgi:hypothetical protein
MRSLSIILEEKMLKWSRRVWRGRVEKEGRSLDGRA